VREITAFAQEGPLNSDREELNVRSQNYKQWDEKRRLENQ
jgi:hypothetical protein